MYGENAENIFFYLTIYNEPYVQPAEPENFDPEGVLRGIYRYRPATESRTNTANILASGVVDARGAAGRRHAGRRMGRRRRRVVGDQLERAQPRRRGDPEGAAAASGPARRRAVRDDRCCPRRRGPFIAVSDWMRAVPEQIRPWVPGTYVTLGTDGFGFSDTRPAARRYFNTDAESQVVAVLEALARDGEIDPSVPVAAARQYRIDDVQAAPAQTSDPGPGA